jgi:hypothetical protein
MRTCVRVDFPASPGSMSMWIILVVMGSSDWAPELRSENLVPTARMTSASRNAWRATSRPCIPMIPRERGWSSGMAPSP